MANSDLALLNGEVLKSWSTKVHVCNKNVFNPLSPLRALRQLNGQFEKKDEDKEEHEDEDEVEKE